ncbi:MAG: hypothetical protein JWP11_3222 [Frankiales bacterium]|nr:hypothetical protein [Frankiales bacterium]
MPAVAGVYGWWFNEIPGAIDVRGCHRWNDLVLLYTGISPKRPPGSGRPPSRGQLRQRLQTHCSGNAEGSTLRKTLGCLLTERLGIELRRVGSGKRMTFVEGEAALSRWMSEHAFVSWVERERPWELEDHLIARLDLPLNLEGNARNAFHTELSGVRARSVSRANALPVVPNPGAGGSMAPRLPAAGRE